MTSTLRWLQTHRIAVLKGGWSRERPISLKTGAAIEAAFKRLKVPFVSIDVRKDIAAQLKRRHIEFAFIGLHGTFGEDGGIQSLLQKLKIPYTASEPKASHSAMDKVISKQKFVRANVPTPRWKTLRKGQSTSAIEKWMKTTHVFVKPVDQGSAIGASRVDKPSDLRRALKSCFQVSKTALIEEFVSGRELTVGVLGKKALPVVEIVPKHAFYDFHSKYAAGGSRHLVPAPIPKKLAKRAQQYALKAFRSVKCSVYGRVDVMLTKEGKMFVLEVNTIPGMTATSLLPDAARNAGLSFDQLVLKICDESLKARGIR